MDILEQHAHTADQVRKGLLSPQVAASAAMAKCSSAAEFQARRMFNAAMVRFRSDVQDAAAVSHAFNTELLRFLSTVAEHAPTMSDWDQAMHRQAGGQ